MKHLTFADALHSILFELNKKEDTIVKNTKTKEILNYSFTLTNPLSCLFQNEEHSSKLKYIAGETCWYFLKRNDVEFISKYSNFWKNICNPDGTCTSAYGNLIFNGEWKWALNSLIKDPFSRQAIITFNKPEHKIENTKDFPCTIYGIFHIRKNLLHLSVFMRSNDVIFGLCNDIVFFTLLQQQMLNHLLPYYPNLKLGDYTHTANSLHIYERHYDKVSRMLDSYFIPNEISKMKLNLINPDESVISELENLVYQGICPDDNLYKFLKSNI